MANEAVLKIETHIPINYTVSTTVTIEKGAICKVTNPMTASLSDGVNDKVAGIIQSEKLAAETTQNSGAIFRGGVFRVNVCGVASTGDPMVTGIRTNSVQVAATNQENIIGTMMEDATDDQTKLMELRPTTMQLA